MHYYVVGINGSGKTALVNTVSQRTGIAAVHGTTVLMEYLGISGDYDALRAMDQAEVLQKWGETAESLISHFEDKSFMLDTHIMNLTHGAMTRRDGPWIAKYGALVLVTTWPELILARLTADSKDRALFPSGISNGDKLELISIYQDDTKRLFNELAEHTRLPHLVLENDAELDQCVQRLIEFDASLKQHRD